MHVELRAEHRYGAIYPSHRQKQTLTNDPHLLAELNVLEGKVAYEAVVKKSQLCPPSAIDLMAADPKISRL